MRREGFAIKDKKIQKNGKFTWNFFFFLQFNLTWSQKLMFTFTQFYSKIFFICTQHFNNIGYAKNNRIISFLNEFL
jgi:hypothetical protein